MATKAFQKIYTQLEAITKATVTLRAKGISNDELAVVDGKLAQVVKTKGDLVTLQVFSGTEGIPTDAQVTFLGAAGTRGADRRPFSEPLQKEAAFTDNPYRNRRHRLEQHSRFRTEDSVLCRP